MDILLFTSIPANSLLLVPEEERTNYLDKALLLPIKLQDVIFSMDTGGFVRGMAKSYDVDMNLSPNIALAILFVAIGEKTFAELPTIFSTELGLSSDIAQKMASEIEHDIFDPVRSELDGFLASTAHPSPYEGEGTRDEVNEVAASRITAPHPRPIAPRTPRNILDLKEIAAKKRQELLSAKPTQPALPKRQLPKPAVSSIDFNKF